MCGGAKKAFERAEPILKELSSTIRYIGKSGEAAKVKALVNMVMNINTAGLAEGLGLGDALGLDLTMLREVFAQTGAEFARSCKPTAKTCRTATTAVFSPPPTRRRTAASRCNSPEDLGLDLPLARATKEQYDAMIAEGLGELDKSGIAELTFKNRHKHRGDHV